MFLSRLFSYGLYFFALHAITCTDICRPRKESVVFNSSVKQSFYFCMVNRVMEETVCWLYIKGKKYRIF